MNKEQFLFLYQNEYGILKQSQVEGLLGFLSYLEADKYITDIRWQAYILATAKHEVAGTWHPIHEYGDRKYFINRYGSQTKVGKILGNDTPEEGADYAGRGWPQVTGENNYEMLEKALPKEYPEVIARWEAAHGKKFDLTVGDQPNDSSDPDAMMDPEIAYCAMSYAMRKGAFTGVGLAKYINTDKCDYVNARKIINGLDCAQKIAEYAKTMETFLKEATA